ncbi:hypothetical protein Q7P37_004861 [Cladosporium fusiforme]
MIHGALRDGRRRAAIAPSTKFSFICSRPTAWQSRAFAIPPAQGSATTNHSQTPLYGTNPTLLSRKRQHVQHRIENDRRRRAASKLKTQEFTSRLDHCLPPHLRSDAAHHTNVADNQEFKPRPAETADLVLEAEGFLSWLAVQQGRWKAAVWIVKLLLECYHSESPHSNCMSHLIQQWNRTGTLDDLLDEPLYLVSKTGEVATPHVKQSSAASLDELTSAPDRMGHYERKRHDILGVIWCGIGRLIISCANDPNIAGGEVKTEILEMIALLHHYELMPSSIYTYVPSESEDAIQQPPTLHLLSSRIMTALSDATWRAREMSAMEEAKRTGSSPLGPEAKGASYRVRVSGIKPEVWLELILWSCLHGGWTLDGAALLSTLCRTGNEKWMPISWRDALSAIVPFGRDDLLDWDNIKYMFDNRSTATMDAVDVTGLRIEKTISSEVVNAYIDALLNAVRVGVGERGIPLSAVMTPLRNLRGFLKRANLNLGGGSWDAMLLRLVESGGTDIQQDPSILRRLARLSPRIGDELKSRRSQVLPAYVLDGSAALLGLLHRALYAEIKNGNLEGALEAFKLLQERVDDDRHRSLSDFFEHMHLNSAKSGSSSRQLFTSNFSGIDYPSFDTQIPPTTLAAFLELVTDNKVFDFGYWMLNNQDIDGPIISDHMYSEPTVSAAIVRFANAVDDKQLLSKVTELGSTRATDGRPTVPNELLQAFFDMQIELRQWDSALRILEHMRDTEGFNWSVANAASVAKVMILESRPEMKETTTSFKYAKAFFQAMLAGRYGTPTRIKHFAFSFDTLSIVLSTIDTRLAALFDGLHRLPKHPKFTLDSIAFNKIVDGVACAQGSKAARVLVERFTQNPKDLPTDESGKLHQVVETFPQRIPPAFRTLDTSRLLSRTVVTLADARATRVAVYGNLKLSPSTMHIICRQALKELRERGDGAAEDEDLELFIWALKTLGRYNVPQTAVWHELESGGLSERDLETVREAVGMRVRRTVDDRFERDMDGSDTVNDDGVEPDVEQGKSEQAKGEDLSEEAVTPGEPRN